MLDQLSLLNWLSWLPSALRLDATQGIEGYLVLLRREVKRDPLCIVFRHPFLEDMISKSSHYLAVLSHLALRILIDKHVEFEYSAK